MCLYTHLTHLPLDKMAANLADNNFKCIFLMKMIPIRITLEFVPRSPIDNKPALLQPELMLTHFTDTHMRH